MELTSHIGEALQWGHAFSDVEINAERNCSTDTVGFNGATPFQTWKLDYRAAGLYFNLKLQWGHAFSDVEME